MATLPDDVAALRAIIAAQAAELAAKDGLIGTLRLQLAKLRRQQFGRSSERLDRDIDQLELALEDLEAEQAATAPAHDGDKAQAPPVTARPARRPLPDHLPRDVVEHPAPTSCPACGGSLRPLGEDVTEILDWMAAWSRQRAGPMCAAGSTTCTSLAPPRSPAILTTPLRRRARMTPSVRPLASAKARLARSTVVQARR